MNRGSAASAKDDPDVLAEEALEEFRVAFRLLQQGPHLFSLLFLTAGQLLRAVHRSAPSAAQSTRIGQELAA